MDKGRGLPDSEEGVVVTGRVQYRKKTIDVEESRLEP
jgi:hypothetical protein